MTRALAAGLFGLLLGTAPSAMAGHGADTTVATIPAQYAKTLLDLGQPLVFVDVRPVGEFRRGHVRGARSIPLEELPTRFHLIPRSGLVVLYCDCPLKQIEPAYLFLRGQGYRTITVMEDGLAAWKQSGFPIEK